MAIPTFQSVSTKGESTGTLTVPMPSSWAADDILLVFAQCLRDGGDTNSVTLTTANGFAALPNSPQVANLAGGPKLYGFWKRAVGSDAAPVTNDPGDHVLAVSCAIRGCITSGNPWNVTSFGNETTLDTSLSVPGATTTVDNCLVVIVASDSGDTAGAEYSAWTNADLGSLTEQYDQGTNLATGGTLAIVTGTKATAGAYGSTTATTGGNSYKAYMTLALQGAAAAAGGFLDGRLDEVAVFSVHLSPSQISALYAEGSAAATFDLDQRSFRFRNDDGTETTATWKDLPNTNVTAVRDANVRLRFEVQEVGNQGGATTAQLQYQKNSGGWNNVTGASLNVRASASANVTDGAATTDQLTIGTGTFVPGSFDEVDGAVASVTLGPRGHTEPEFCFQIRSADVAIGDLIELRLTFGGDASPAYTQVPAISVIGALPVVDQKTFRGRNDDGDETTATWKAVQGTDWTQDISVNFRVRFQLQETAAGSGPLSVPLRYSKNGGAYADVTATSSNVRAVASANVSDDQVLTEQLTGGTGTYVQGRFDELDGLANPDPLVASGHTEVEYCLQLVATDVAQSDTINLRINPSGTGGATTFTDTPIITANVPVTLEQRAFRGRNDDGDETTATWKTIQNTNWSQLVDENFRVRFEVQALGGLVGASTAQLQYRKNLGTWTNVSGASTNVRSFASPNLADGAATTNQLTAGTGSFVAGTFDEVDGAVASVSFGANGHTEWEFAVQIRSADVASNDTIQLRLIFGGDANPTYTQTPTITATVPTFDLQQKAFRGRNDDGTETTATWKAAQNTNFSQAVDTVFRMRLEIQETGGAAAASTAQLQYRKNGGTWTDVNAASTNARSAASPNVTDGAATTNQLTAGTGTFVAGTFDEVDGAVASVSFAASGHTEWEWALLIRSADVVNSDTIELRVTTSGDAAPVYTQVPLITAVKVDVTTLFLSGGTTGTAYSQGLTAINGTPPYAWSIVTGSLPTGLTLTGATISGTPSAIGTYPFVVRVTDSSGTAQTDDQSLSIVITDVSLPVGLSVGTSE